MLEIARETLENGLGVVFVQLPHVHSCSIAAFVKVGSRYETGETRGLSHLLEHMLFRGTERHPSSFLLNDAIESIGGSLEAATYADFTSYDLSLPPENLRPGVEILSEVLSRPLLQGLETEVSIIEEEIADDLDEDGREIDPDNLTREFLFLPHSLGFTITGTVDHLRRYTEKDLRRHLSQYYGARNMVLGIAGPFSATDVFQSVRDTFSSLQSGSRSETIAPESYRVGPFFQWIRREGNQSDLRVASRTMGELDRRYPALQMLTRILDDGLSTRLHRRVCDEKGIAYDVSASIEPYEECGIFEMSGVVQNGKVTELLPEFFSLLREIRDERVPDRELEKAKRRFLWDLRRAQDDASAISEFFALGELLGTQESLDSLSEKIKSVTSEGVRDVAREVCAADRMQVLCVGAPQSEALTELEELTRGFV